MGKKKENKVEEIKVNTSNIAKAEIGDEIIKRMMPYSLSVILSRALPEIIDGFKPSQRFWLAGMKSTGANGERTIKSGTISGEVMGKYNPHANSYLTGTRMTDQAETLLTPFIIGQGSFGKHYSGEMAPAAERYTEMRLSPIGREIVEDSYKNHPSNMEDNYNGTCKQPKYISAPFPNILANPQTGIAVGYACEFGSFNLKELCEASKIVVKNSKKSNKELLKEIKKVMPTMDFTTGGETCVNDEQIDNIYLNGKGQVVVRAIIEDNKANKMLEIKEIPYSTTLENIMSAVLKAVDSGKLPEVSDIRNETDINGLKLTVDYKSGTDIELLKKKLYSLTPCQCALNANMYAVTNGVPGQVGVIDCIKGWAEYRKKWVEEGLNEQLKDNKATLHLLEGLEAILLDIDKAIKIVRQSKTDEEVIEGLKKAFKIDEIQAEYVANIKLRNLNKDWIINKTKEIKNLKDIIKDIETRLKDINKELLNDLDRVIKDYGIERKTKISEKWEELPSFNLNAKEPVKLDGESTLFIGPDYVKRVPNDSGAKAPNGAIKYENIPNSAEILIFTNEAKCFKWVIGKLKNNTQVKITDIKQIKKKLDAGEQILYICPLLEKNKLVVAFSNKKFVKFSLSLYKTEGNKLLFKKGVNDKEPIEYIESINKDKKITVFDTEIDTKEIKEFSNKTAQGMKIKGVK